MSYNINTQFFSMFRLCLIKTKVILLSLTSPHVNKISAQEQFKTEFFVSKIMITSNQIPKLLIFLKQINKNLFVNVDLKLKFI